MFVQTEQQEATKARVSMKVGVAAVVAEARTNGTFVAVCPPLCLCVSVSPAWRLARRCFAWVDGVLCVVQAKAISWRKEAASRVAAWREEAPTNSITHCGRGGGGGGGGSSSPRVMAIAAA